MTTEIKINKKPSAVTMQSKRLAWSTKRKYDYKYRIALYS